MAIQPFQYIGVKEAYEAKKFLIADEMGMFKTAQAILVDNKIRAEDPDLQALVVCPTSVKEHWAKEIGKWAYPKGQEVTIVATQDFDRNIKDAKDSQWVVMHYPLLSTLDTKRLNKLRFMDFGHVVLDEVHNAKNPQALRTQAIKVLADKTEDLTLLSGTPIPNSVQDIYMLMHFLEPGSYPLTGKQNIDSEAKQRFLELYWQKPQEFKELVHRRMLSRRSAEFMKLPLPKFEEKNICIDLKGEWLEAYSQILEESLPAGQKIMQLEKVLTDTKLVDSSKIRKVDLQPKYEALDDIVKQEIDKDGKVLVFTNLKKGVVDKLVDRYADFGAIAITGDIPTYGTSRREQLRQQFQHDAETKVLIATTAMHEGVDLTAASAVVNLMLPWMPAEYWQRIKRAHRPGEVQHDKVTAYNLIAHYPAKLRKSLDEARWDMLQGKQKVIKYLQGGIRLSREELQDLQEQ